MADRPRLPPSPADFAARLGAAPKILVVEFGGLGDHLHSLPALKLLRDHFPNAKITMMVGGGAAVFRELVPWIDEVWSYARQGLGSDIRWLRRLRAQHFDAAIQLMQSNRGAVFVGLSGARLRLARRNDEHKPWRWQPWLLSHVVEQPYHRFPMYRQRWRALHSAGLAGDEPAALAAVEPSIDPALRRAKGIDRGDDGTYIHLSASASDDARDLPAAQMIALWQALAARFPQHRLVVTAAGDGRARQRLQTLLDGLGFVPWKVFTGDLDIPGFAAVVQGAALHVGPDSGGLHVARLVGTPSVSWFRPNHHIANWLPDEPGHLAFTAPESRGDGLHGLEVATLVDAAASLLPDC